MIKLFVEIFMKTVCVVGKICKILVPSCGQRRLIRQCRLISVFSVLPQFLLFCCAKRCRWNGKQCRPWSDCSFWSGSTWRSSLICVHTVCPDLSVPKLRNHYGNLTLCLLLVLDPFHVNHMNNKLLLTLALQHVQNLSKALFDQIWSVKIHASWSSKIYHILTTMCSLLSEKKHCFTNLFHTI